MLVRIVRLVSEVGEKSVENSVTLFTAAACWEWQMECQGCEVCHRGGVGSGMSHEFCWIERVERSHGSVLFQWCSKGERIDGVVTLLLALFVCTLRFAVKRDRKSTLPYKREGRLWKR